MKKLFLIGIVALSLLAGCKTPQSATTNNDDVYYSRPKHVHAVREIAKDQDLSAPQTLASSDTGKLAASSSSTSSSGWYDDYDYSSRIKRFKHPVKDATYYDETYTNPGNYDSTSQSASQSSPDVNIYINGSYWPYWGSGFSWGVGFGWGDNWDFGWGYPWYSPYFSWNYPYGWYSPYYSWGYPYDYWSGYYNGYWNGYWDGMYDWHHGFSPYYSYYGPRRSFTPGNGGPDNHNRNLRAPGETTSPATANQRVAPSYSRPTGSGATRSTVNSGVSPKVSPDQERYQYSRPAQRQGANYQRSGNNYAQRQSQKTAPRYVRPEVNAQPSRTVETQKYSSPSYRQPKSSQEYLTPRSQSNVRTQPSNTNQRKNYSIPSNNNRNYSNPGNSRTYGQPSRNNPSPTYSVPSRSGNSGYSSPSRSGGSSYSAPSRSGGSSYSAPSRSSGSSGSSSGSSSGNGRRR
ncbi:MAG: hypothetical protein Q8867_04155 [Bacteroidota bacterium]|nr:hypothetical protein [Bacteroidota bacterium]